MTVEDEGNDIMNQARLGVVLVHQKGRGKEYTIPSVDDCRSERGA